MMRGTGLLLLALCLWTDQAWSQGTDLGGGIITRTDVEELADLTLDVRDIRELLSSGEGPDEALLVYQNGRNAETNTTENDKLSLRQLSLNLVSSLDKGSATPSYLYHLYGLSNRKTAKDKLSAQALYGDNFARSAIEGNNQAGDAILALNVWMYATHVLYTGVDTCHKLTKADNPEILTLGGGGMDEFIALWIGHGTAAGTLEGHGLYSLTQLAGDLFGKNSPEAAANTALKALYQEGSAILSFPNACARDDDRTPPQLWLLVQRMISQMTIPLMQLLIDALVEEEADRVKLYALALVPQVAQCRPSVYKRLKEELLGNTITFSRTQDILADLQQAYDCFGFTCADIGAYKVDQLEECTDFPVNYPLAEYAPTTRVHEHAKIDLDILQVKILTSLRSYSFAKYLYMYGRNSPLPRKSDSDPYEVRSLRRLATTSEREVAVPFYTEFVEYHDDTNYGDTTVMQALEGSGKWGASSDEARTEVVSKTCSYQIMYMYALAEMGDALADCASQNPLDNVGGSHSWDEVVAFLIGSLEGPTEGGSADTDDGQLLWNLANQRAFQFQTENGMGYSKINSDLEDLMYAGRGQLDAFDCKGLKKTTTRIEHLILIPVIQSTLRFAAENAKLGDSSTSKNLAEGETFTLSVLPIVKSYDESAAQVIAENMIIQSGVTPVRDGAQVVADAFYEALDEFGVSCELVGASSQVDACAKEGGFSSSIRLRPYAYTLVLGTLALMAGMIL